MENEAGSSSKKEKDPRPQPQPLSDRFNNRKFLYFKNCRETNNFFLKCFLELSLSSTDHMLSRLILKNVMEIKDGQTKLVGDYGKIVSYIEQQEEKEAMAACEISGIPVENENQWWMLEDVTLKDKKTKEILVISFSLFSL